MNNTESTITEKFVRKNLITKIGNYYLIDVFEKVDDYLSREIQKLWLKHKALPPNQNWPQRARETTLLLLDQDFNIVGLTSSFAVTLHDMMNGQKTSYGSPDDLFYCYRLYTIPTLSIINTPKILTCETFDLLRKKKKHKAKGVITTLDNPKLNRVGALGLFRKYKFDILIERTPSDKTVVGRKFSAGKINLPKNKPRFFETL